MAVKPVFFDATGRRAVGASIVGWTAGAVSLVLGAVFVFSLVNAPMGAQPRLPGHLTAIAIHDLEKKALKFELSRIERRVKQLLNGLE